MERRRSQRDRGNGLLNYYRKLSFSLLLYSRVSIWNTLESCGPPVWEQFRAGRVRERPWEGQRAWAQWKGRGRRLGLRPPSASGHKRQAGEYPLIGGSYLPRLQSSHCINCVGFQWRTFKRRFFWSDSGFAVSQERPSWGLHLLCLTLLLR